jgi:hypothetical protein
MDRHMLEILALRLGRDVPTMSGIAMGVSKRVRAR